MATIDVTKTAILTGIHHENGPQLFGYYFDRNFSTRSAMAQPEAAAAAAFYGLQIPGMTVLTIKYGKKGRDGRGSFLFSSMQLHCTL